MAETPGEGGTDLITARLREMAGLFRERGFVAKGVDMSPHAVSDRLRVLGALSDMCRRLGEWGARHRAGGSDPDAGGAP